MILAPLVAFWTARSAQARGRNPWLWGGAALVLGIPWPWPNLPILGVLPVLFLMFFVRPASSRNPEQLACSKCASPHAPGQNFCTRCGWDLSVHYSPDSTDTVLASEMHQSASTSTPTRERSSEPAAPDPTVETTPHASPPVSSRADDVAWEEPSATSAVSDGLPQEAETVLESEDTPDGEPEIDPQVRPWGVPVPGPAPTAVGMTARGADLLHEGKLQEAIDQFTKAIALDPTFPDAFRQRAEAFSRQGRQDRADEDNRQAQSLTSGA